MADYRLSSLAADDIRTLYQSSRAMFGARQTDLYMEGLGRALRNLAEIPGMGRSAEDLAPGLFRFRFQSHMIFYTVEPDLIVVRRIMHARMDFGSQL